MKYDYWVTTPGSHNTTNPWVTTVYSNSYAGAFTEGEGAYTFKVRGISSDNRVSNWSNTCTITYDKTAPAMPSLTSPANNSYVKGDSLENKWTSVSGVDHYIYESYNNSATTSLRWRQKVTGTSKIATNVNDTAFWWRVKAVDAAGNESAWSPVWKVTVDNKAPIANITAPIADSTVSGIVTITGTITDTNPRNSYFRVTGPNGYSVSDFHGDGRLTHDFLWNTHKLDNGTYKIQFETRDLAGNKTSVSTKAINVTVDNPAPIVGAEDFGIGPWTIENNGYTGFSVDFSLSNFKTVKGITIDVYGKKGILVTNMATSSLPGMVNSPDNLSQLSSPFIVNGTLIDEYCDSGPCWDMGSTSWSATDIPLRAVISVTGTDIGDRVITKTAENTNFSGSVSDFAHIIPRPVINHQTTAVQGANIVISPANSASPSSKVVTTKVPNSASVSFSTTTTKPSEIVATASSDATVLSANTTAEVPEAQI